MRAPKVAWFYSADGVDAPSRHRNVEQSRHASCRVLLRHEPQLCTKIASLGKGRAVADSGDKCGSVENSIPNSPCRSGRPG